MNMFKNLYKVCAAALLSLGLFGCQEQEMVQPYALLAESSLTFAAKGAEAQVLTIASQENWVVDVDSDWISIDVTSGSGTVYANVSVTDNVDANGVLAAPRQGKITIAATRGEYSVETVIYQKGDTYLEAQEYTVSALAALENTEETPQIPVKVKDAVVVAAANDGFVISDGTVNVLVSGSREVAAGNKVSLNGQKVTLGGLPVLLVDEVLSNDGATEAAYPTPTDISGTVDSYKSDKVEYVTVSGTLVDNTILNIAGSTKSVTAYKAAALAEYNIHKVTVTGYYAGPSASGAPTIVIATVKSNGEDTEFGSPFPYSDDFSWLDPLVEQANAVLPADSQINDSVGEVTSSSDGAANIYTTLVTANVPVLDQLRARGYTDLNPGQKTIYLQQGYMKYGKGACQSGLTFPFLKIEGTQDIAVSFRWCAHMAGDGGIDETQLVVGFTGPGSIDGGSESVKVPGQIISKPIAHAQEANKMFWNDAMVIIKGATRATNITIRPCDEQFGSVEDPKSGYYRYYIDDISVVNAADAVQSKITVTGVENGLITFEGTPEGPATFDVTAEKDYKIMTSAKWFSVSETEGAGGELKTVEVICEQSELSESRKGTITIKSGTSTEVISVVQSAAGQTLAPFMSIVGGNSGNVNFEAGSFGIDVQSNVDYEFTSDASWVTVESVATKALVETTPLKVTYEANTVEKERVAHIRIFNSEENIETVYTLTQAAYESGIYFQDDFTWVAPWADAYGADDSVADNNPSGKAPNVYTHATHLEGGVPGYPAFLTEFANRGYVDLNAEKTSFYTQKYYLKFGKTNVHTGIKLPANDFEGTTPVDVELSFNWAAHMTGGGSIDKVKIVVELEGDGVCGDSGAKISNLFETTQVDGQLAWQDAKILLKGVTNNTRISIRPSVMDNSDDVDQKRWYIDNIKIAKPTPIFSDNFNWVAPWADAYGADDSVADNNPSGKAPNVYTHATHLEGGVPGYPAFLTEFANRGYVDLNAEKTSFYTQKYYLKFGKTNVHTGIKLPALKIDGTKDVNLSFNWCAHMTGGGSIDKVKIVVELEGDGVCADTGAKISNLFETTQVDGTLAWQDAAIVLKGVTANTRIIIRPSVMDNSDDVDQKRWYIDNINIY